MARPSLNQPTELELRLLKILWEKSPQPVRDIREVLRSEGRDIAHTSVITTLNTMVRKRYLRRTKQGKAFLFSPRISQEKVSRQVLGNVVDNVFGGSAKAVLLSLFDCAEIDEEELKELRRLVKRKARETKE